MVILAIVLAAMAILLTGGTIYSRIISRALGESADRATPAVSMNDGVDYVPTPTPVVFAHHFASIAGAGPIVGPILALAYGWGPALLWVIFGGILAGGVHDYVAMYVSMRERGKSIAVIARESMGRTAFLCFVSLLVVLLILVCAQFLKLSANALTSQIPPEVLGLTADQSMFRMVTETNAQGEQQTYAVIGGIASTSVIFITMLAPLLGFLYIKRNVSVAICSLLAVFICGLSIAAGFWMPVMLTPSSWMLAVSAYCVFAAGLPVWMFLQSRDFINVHMLYVGLTLLVSAVLLAGLQGVTPSMQMLDMAGGMEHTKTWSLWPFLFITVSCGALSGFHSLCATGTTPKQLKTERAARYVGYWAMLLESFLAVCVITACLVAMQQSQYLEIVYKQGNPVLAFAIAVGQVCHLAFDPIAKMFGVGFPVAFGAVFGMLLLEGFLVTTLDTAVRLTRYLLDELWATLFSNYDVFAARSSQEADRFSGGSCCGLESPELETAGSVTASVTPAGAAGLDTHPQLLEHRPPRRIIATSGITRLVMNLLLSYWVNSGMVVLLMLWLAFSPVSSALWPIFGSGNQLLAALALLVVSVWLAKAGKPVWYTLLPCGFMMVTTLTMLVQLAIYNYGLGALLQGNADVVREKWPLLVFDGIMLGLTSALLISGLRVARGLSAGSMTSAAVTASR